MTNVTGGGIAVEVINEPAGPSWPRPRCYSLNVLTATPSVGLGPLPLDAAMSLSRRSERYPVFA